MLEFNDSTMVLTRGDTVYIDTVILTPLGFVYEVQEEDVIKFYVYKRAHGESIGVAGINSKPVIEKEFVDRKLKLETNDTAFLSVGKYYYKCVITMKGDIRETYCEGDFILK